MDQPAAYSLFVAHAQAERAWVRGDLLPALGLSAEQVITREEFRPGAAALP